MIENNDNKLMVITREGRGKGRPKGSLNEGRIRYRPKKWLPEYNQLVLDYIIIPNVTYKELGEKYGYTEVHIGNILRSPQAKDIQEATALGILGHNKENSIIKLGEISKKITERLHTFIHDDSIYRANPFEFINKSLSIGKAIGVLDKETASDARGATVTHNTNTQVNIAISGKDARDLGDSLELVNKLRIESSGGNK